MNNCNHCECPTCDANNKKHSTDPLNTCYGCDGKDETCTKPITKNDCLYQCKKQQNALQYYVTNQEKVEKLVKDLMSYPDGRIPLSSDILEEMSIDGVKIIAACMIDNENCTYRTIYGYAKLDEPIITETNEFHVETQYIHFCFEIYVDNCIWNRVSYARPFFILDKDALKANNNDSSEITFISESMSWGKKGHQTGVLTKTLSGTDLTRRLFERNLQNVSRTHKWGQEIKTKHKKHMKG